MTNLVTLLGRKFDSGNAKPAAAAQPVITPPPVTVPPPVMPQAPAETAPPETDLELDDDLFFPLAARLGQVLIGDVTGFAEGPVFVRQLMQGRLNGSYRHSGNGPCFVSVQAGAFRADEAQAGTAAISDFVPAIEPAQIRTKPSERFRGAAQTVDLGSAQMIVGVGRGIKDPANIPIAQELATALGAELGASRPICDNGWLPMERQIGSSGQTISPKLYLAVGISGAIQHLVGIKGSQCVVAINKDPDAPIFEVADYGIVGDLMEVVPALTEALKAAKQ